jgi:hypothetical protein
MRAIAYIDGFNLYYRAVRGTPYKWLNLRRACELLVPEHTLSRLKYFTAPVSGKFDPNKPTRQETYFRALRTVGCEIIKGNFLTHDVDMPLSSNRHQLVTVIKTEEKGSDVNLASHLLIDGFTHQYEAAIILTNDSDLAMPIRYIRDDLKMEIIVINPNGLFATKKLVQSATSIRHLRTGVLAAAQFPDIVQHAKGVIHKPPTW